MSRLVNPVRRSKLSAASALAIGSAVVLAPTASAQEDISVEFPAGMVCDFDIALNFPGPARDGWGGGVFFAGMNGPIEVTNLDSGETLVVPQRGLQARSTAYDPADGSDTVTFSGTLVLASFPNDDPGPALTLTTGRVVYEVSPDGSWTLTSQSGQTTDLCAELS